MRKNRKLFLWPVANKPESSTGSSGSAALPETLSEENINQLQTNKNKTVEESTEEDIDYTNRFMRVRF
jgi:hypothetical protein